ncbi:MAG: GGDEF domain-containing protein [Nitrospirota bacterium]
MFDKIKNIITFADLPIKKKFTFFSTGVLCWFVILFLIGLAEVPLYTSAAALLIATALLIFFTIAISRSISKPVKSITKHIRSFGKGKIDLSQKNDIRSNDEIGNLSKIFYNLMEEINDLAAFKKVIEEDENLEDVYSRLGHAFQDKVGLDEFIIYEVATDEKKMRPVYPVIINEQEIYCSEEILNNCTLCKVEKTGHMISSVSYPNVCRQFKSGPLKAHVCIPMIIGGKTGVIVQFLIDSKKISLHPNDKRIFRADRYIKESLSVIEAKRLTNTLKESALKDSLTGLYNRRFLQEYTETLIAGVLRRERTVGLIMCDLDFFKQVNDFYGHSVGDTVLRETSKIIRKCIRSSDLIIRYGGEEFLILMLDINEGETLTIAEKIRETTEETKIKVSDGIIKKTISLGISEFPTDTDSFWQAIKYADAALYRAKEIGRNKAIRFTEHMRSESSMS